MSDVEIERLTRENNYLKLRCAQLQDDVSDLNSQVARLTEARERMGVGPAARTPNPLAGGQ